MKKILWVVMIIVSIPTLAQTKKQNKMEKQVFNPWQWQDQRSYVQAVEVKNVTGTLYVSGQAAIDSTGRSSTADMKTQLLQAMDNLETVIKTAGYDCKNIVRLNIYTTSSEELLPVFFEVFQPWVKQHGMKQAVTLMEVKSLFETLKVELEATVVK